MDDDFYSDEMKRRLAEIDAEAVRKMANICMRDATHDAMSGNDNTFDNRPIIGTNGIITHSVIAFLEIEAREAFEGLDKNQRERVVDVVSEIIAMGNAIAPAQRFYDAMNNSDLPKDEPKKDHLSKLDTTISDMSFTFSELSMDRQNKELREVMEAATTWGEREDITPLERCHGLAQALYSEWGTDSVLSAEGGSVPTNPGRNYAKAYDHEFADRIKDRSMRAAKELFGS